MSHQSNIRRLIFASMMAAVVYVASAFLQLSIPTAIGTTRIHLGNVMCLLSGMLLGPVYGGVAAGVGSMLFDLTSPVYISSAPFTFIFKFAMAWLCGKIVKKRPDQFGFIFGSIAGALLYTLLYITKNFVEYCFVFSMPLEGVLLMSMQKGIVSCINAVLSVAIAVPLGSSLRPIIKRFLL